MRMSWWDGELGGWEANDEGVIGRRFELAHSLELKVLQKTIICTRIHLHEIGTPCPSLDRRLI